ncbi:hypothetical protein GPECTOR_2g1587 [Gonium pectorale]|uniref:Chromosome segregation in meiosis protein 3 domain-containing protein n=1 Tax=Gonium pectorale TaxID=33097 RepID=A0A150H1V1_GONPE|nr:hypothetical protein GPECTOR_2g1587 [Gonium pectorale]|eukprot:KXZ56035.1 hypothetical protein GPECTOR_2g1587 [Gonium pectorale]
MDQGGFSDDGRGTSPGADRGATAAPTGPDGEPPKPTRAPRKKDPKLDLDLLEAEGGFNDVWHKIVPAFKATYQGEGHEVADLRRLLELYQRWQMRFYPHCDFDAFSKLTSMRQNLLGLIFPTEQPGEEPEAVAQQAVAQQAAAPTPAAGVAVGAAAPGQAAGGATPGANVQARPAAAAGAGRAADPWDEDEELVALQRDVEWEAAQDVMDELEAAGPAAPRAPAAAAGPSEMDLQLEELMRLAEEAQQRPTPAAPSRADGAAATAAAPVDPDDELIALAMEHDGATAAGAAATAAARPAAPAAGAAPLPDDDELLALAMDYEAPTAAPAPPPAAADAAAQAEDDELIALAMGYNDARPAPDAAGGDSGGQPMEEVDEDDELFRLAAAGTVDAVARPQDEGARGAAEGGVAKAEAMEIDGSGGGGGLAPGAGETQLGTEEDLDAALMRLPPDSQPTQTPQAFGAGALSVGSEACGSNPSAPLTVNAEVAGAAGGGGAFGSAADGSAAGPGGSQGWDGTQPLSQSQPAGEGSQGAYGEGLLRGILMTATQEDA